MRRARFGVVAAVMLIGAGICGGDAAAGDGFSLKSFRGSYASIFSGKINTGSGLISILGTGIFVADGKGSLSGHETYTVDTTPCEATIAGTYTVDSDGSGTDAVTFTTSSPGCTSGSYTQSFAIGERGEVVLLSNTNGDQINEEFHLQTRR
jgi:hypothetical protein